MGYTGKLLRSIKFGNRFTTRSPVCENKGEAESGLLNNQRKALALAF